MKMRNLINTIAIVALFLSGMSPSVILADPRIDHSGSPYCEFPKLADNPFDITDQYEDTCVLSLDRIDGDIDSAIGISVTPDQFGDALEPYSIYGCPTCPANMPCKVIDRKGAETAIANWFLEVNVDCVDANCTVTRRLICWHPFG